MHSLVCPLCGGEMKWSKLPEWSREEEMYVKRFYLCKTGDCTAVSDRGIMTYFDANGNIVASGE